MKSYCPSKPSFSMILTLALFFLGVGSFAVHSQTTKTNTTLTQPEHIETFMDVTEKLRCICLPSLPIQGCTYNICAVSSYLKTFIENKIREGMSGEEIIYKFQHGFGSSILEEPKDPVVLHFQRQGNQGMINSLVNGFGKNIQAQPDSTWINLFVIFIGIGGLAGIGYYLVQRKKAKEDKSDNSPQENQENAEQLKSLEKKYLEEM